MRRFSDWLTASRVRVIFGAALLSVLALTPLFVSWAPGALVVLLALRNGAPVAAWYAALVSGLTLGWFLLSVGAGPVPAVGVALALIVPPYFVGRLMARGGSLRLAFQFATLAAICMLVVVHLVLSDPPGVWSPFVERLAAELDRMATMMSNSGSGWHPGDAELREAASAIVNWGVVAWILLFNTMVAAVVGLYAYGRQLGVARLGPEFRELQAGRTLAAVALVVTLLSMTMRWDFANDVSRFFLGTFVLQGLALMHAACATLGLGVGWLVAAYVLLFVPFAAWLMQGALVVFGYLDNWLPFRARLVAAGAAKDKGRRG
jgi:hypothetical protein